MRRIINTGLISLAILTTIFIVGSTEANAQRRYYRGNRQVRVVRNLVRIATWNNHRYRRVHYRPYTYRPIYRPTYINYYPVRRYYRPRYTTYYNTRRIYRPRYRVHRW